VLKAENRKGCLQRDGVERERMQERGASALGKAKKEAVQMTFWKALWNGTT